MAQPKSVPTLSSSDISRFWNKVDVLGPKQCWPWRAAKLWGYGAFGIMLPVQKQMICRAHRVMWRIVYGPIPPRQCVLHSCDNPRCVNPSHLFLGLPKDNVQDRDRKARNVKGSKHGAARLTENDVFCIRGTYKRGEVSQQQLADNYKVTRAAISLVIRHRTWKHI